MKAKLTPHKFLYYANQPFTWPGGYDVIFYVADVNPDKPGADGYYNFDTYCHKCMARKSNLKDFYERMFYHEDGDVGHVDIYVYNSADIDPDENFCLDCGRDLSAYAEDD